MKESIIQEKIRNLRANVDTKTEVNDSSAESVDSTYSASKIETEFVKKSGDTMTGDLHSTERFRPDKIWHAYGGFQDKAEALTMSGWTIVTNATNDLFTGLEADGLTLSGDLMTVVNAGDYVGQVSLTFIGSTTKDYHMRIYNKTKGEQMGYIVGSSGLGVNNYQCVSLPIYLECNAGDELQLEVMEAGDTAMTVTDCVFYITYLHD